VIGRSKLAKVSGEYKARRGRKYRVAEEKRGIAGGETRNKQKSSFTATRTKKSFWARMEGGDDSER